MVSLVLGQRAMPDNPLPSFKHPPVVETVLGVQFDPIRGFTNAHLGAFWKSLGAEWPSVADAPPLEQQFEQFGDERAWGSLGFQLKLTSAPASRLQIRNASNDRMIQIQNGRFHLNWLGQAGGEYPRYQGVRPEFDKLFARFSMFVRDQQLGDPKLNQWEVTYVNHIPKGSLWRAPSDVAGISCLFGRPPALPMVAGQESFSGAWHFEITPQRGRLHVEIRHGRRTIPDEQEVLILTLTARGPLGTGEKEYDEGLNLGREVIVRGFNALTSEIAHETWGLQDASNKR